MKPASPPSTDPSTPADADHSIGGDDRASATSISPPNHASRPSIPLEGLPSVSERPQADVVIFDGDCRFCWSQVRRLNWFDRGGRLAYLSLHDPLVAERYPDLTHDQLMAEIYVVDSAGTRRGGASAIRYLTRRLPLLWPLVPFLHFPFSMPLWSWLYHQIAVRRYWLAGRMADACESDACSIHLRKKSSG